MPRAHLLTFEEITHFVEIMARHTGLKKIRLTGGEPLVRQGLHHLIKQILNIPGIEDLGLTTNGILLADQAEDLYNAGLRRINVSLDALDATKFAEITRRSGYEKVLAGITQAQKVGFKPVKINAVSIKGMTEDELVKFGEFTRETGIEVRFIEFMPLDADGNWERDKVLLMDEILQLLGEQVQPLVPVVNSNPHAPATEFQFQDGVGRISFIPSISHPFCATCNRYRLTADGKIRNCLFSLEETDIRELLRSNAKESAILSAVRASITGKWEGHEINTAKFIQPERPMYAIGG
jgi:cyclic pyranopterin phosphate synthase